MRAPLVVRSLVAIGVAAGLAFGQIPDAAADPTPTPSDPPREIIAAAAPRTVAEAQAQLDQLEAQQSAIEEDYNQAQIALADGKRKVEAVQKQVADQQAAVDKLTDQVRSIALLQFQGRSMDTTVQVFTSSDPDSFLGQLSTVSKVDQNMNDTLQSQQLEQARLESMKRGLDADVVALAAQEKAAADLNAQMVQKVADSQALLDQLTEAQRQALAAAAQKQAATFDVSDLSGSDANARALDAVKFAVARVKDSRYVWGAAGPHAFDCSGLMLASYRSVGISLPHSSSAQSHVGRAVSTSELQPGDLLFWYSPIHHVSMYIGGGKMVHAANSRSGLRIDRVSGYHAHFAGARRILG